MKTAVLTIAALALAIPALAADRTERIQFQRGASAKVTKGAIKGYDGVNYLIGARAGQVLDITVSSPNKSVYFNVWAPGNKGEAMFASDREGGNHFSGTLSASGDYRVQIYLYRNEARRGTTANYTLTVGVHS